MKISVSQSNIVRLVTIEYFLQRKRLRPRYTLRALPRDLNIDPGFLSKFFSRKSHLTISNYEKLRKKVTEIQIYQNEILTNQGIGKIADSNSPRTKLHTSLQFNDNLVYEIILNGERLYNRKELSNISALQPSDMDSILTKLESVGLIRRFASERWIPTVSDRSVIYDAKIDLVQNVISRNFLRP